MIGLERVAVRAGEPEHLQHLDLAGRDAGGLRRYHRIVVHSRLPLAGRQLRGGRQRRDALERCVALRLGLAPRIARLLRGGGLLGLARRAWRRPQALLAAGASGCGAAAGGGGWGRRHGRLARAAGQGEQRRQSEHSNHGLPWISACPARRKRRRGSAPAESRFAMVNIMTPLRLAVRGVGRRRSASRSRSRSAASPRRPTAVPAVPGSRPRDCRDPPGRGRRRSRASRGQRSPRRYSASPAFQ